MSGVFCFSQFCKPLFYASPFRQVALYVYTYELADEGHQLYAALNDAMRLRTDDSIAYWRPLIWHIDCALQVSAPYSHLPVVFVCTRT